MDDKIRVLLVEDEQTLAMIIRDTLEPLGFSVDVAYDGETGLHTFFCQHYDVLVADVMMPKMDGFEMVRQSAGKTNRHRCSSSRHVLP